MAEYTNVKMMYKTQSNRYDPLYPITNDATVTEFDINNTHFYADVAQGSNPYITTRYNFPQATLNADNVADAYTEIEDSFALIGRKQPVGGQINITNASLSASAFIRKIYYNPLQRRYYAIRIYQSSATSFSSEIMSSSDGINFNTSVAVYNNRCILDIKFCNGYIVWIFYDKGTVGIDNTGHISSNPTSSVDGYIAKIHIGKNEDISGTTELFNSSNNEVAGFINGIFTNDNKGAGFSVDCDGCTLVYAATFSAYNSSYSSVYYIHEVKGIAVDKFSGNFKDWTNMYNYTRRNYNVTYSMFDDIRIKNIRPGQYMVYNSAVNASTEAPPSGNTLLFAMVDPYTWASTTIMSDRFVCSSETQRITERVTDILTSKTNEFCYLLSKYSSSSTSNLNQYCIYFISPLSYRIVKSLERLNVYRMPLRFRSVQIGDNYIWIGFLMNENYLFFNVNPILDIYTPRTFYAERNGPVNVCKYSNGSSIQFTNVTNCIDNVSLLDFVPINNMIYFSIKNNSACYIMKVLMK